MNRRSSGMSDHGLDARRHNRPHYAQNPEDLAKESIGSARETIECRDSYSYVRNR